MQPRYQIPTNGQEVQVSDLNLLGQVGSQADDAVFSELLRLVPFSTAATKMVLPYGHLGTQNGFGIVARDTLTPAAGTVRIHPFRAFVGSRAAVASGSIANWNDIRSAVFVGTTTTLSVAQVLAPNASGNPRWDLVYAAVSVDANGPAVTRYVKNPTSKVVNAISVVSTLVSSTTIGVVTGTPGASPAYPVIPVDAGGVYYIPLAFVRIPNGFSSTSTVNYADISDIAPVVALSRTTGASSCAPANQSNYSRSTNTLRTRIPWPNSGTAKPAGFIPPSVVGSESIFVKVDTIVSPATHLDGDIIDDSRDWRGRFFLSFIQAGDPTDRLGSDDPTGLAGKVIPNGSSLLKSFTLTTMGSSFLPNNGQVVPFVTQATNAELPAMAAGPLIGVYVDMTTGALKWNQAGGAPNARFFIWITATAPMPT